MKGEAAGGSTERAPPVADAASAVLCERVARASDGRNEARAHSEQRVCEGFTLQIERLRGGESPASVDVEKKQSYWRALQVRVLRFR